MFKKINSEHASAAPTLDTLDEDVWASGTLESPAPGRIREPSSSVTSDLLKMAQVQEEECTGADENGDGDERFFGTHFRRAIRSIQKAIDESRE